MEQEISQAPIFYHQNSWLFSLLSSYTTAMVWYLGLLISAIFSFLLAIRSMRDFQDLPSTKSTDYGLFLVSHPKNLTAEVWDSLSATLKGFICSLELIQKGSAQALVGFFPHFVQAQFPSLGLIEIEDYILGQEVNQADPFILSRQISLNDSFAWKLQPSNHQKPDLTKKQFAIELENDQYLAWQVTFESGDEQIQITPRVIIKDSNPQKKIELIKQVKQQIDQKTSLASSSSLVHAGSYADYKNRTLVPKQVAAFLINKQKLLQFLSG